MSETGQERGSPRPGNRVGRWRIETVLGSGGMATVYRAREEDGRVAAVKVLHPSSVLPEDRKRFGREYETLSRMDHPNIVKVYEAGMAESFPWIAMELVEGEDLEAVIGHWQSQAPPDRWEQVERVLRGLCEGLQYVHDRGLVHRDLKPTNVLCTPDGAPKISDFGVVKDPDATGTQLTKAGRLVGTVAFMAPEQITGDAVDQRADLYSLGAVLYMMLTWRRPIEARSIAGYLARHLTEVPASPGQIEPAVPPRLEQVCMRLLAKDPAQRFPTARAVLRALDRDGDEERVPLRGRDAEVGRWSQWLARVAEGGGGALVLTGRPGSGRTFLMETMLEAARTQALEVVRIRSGEPVVLDVEALRAGAVVAVDHLDRRPPPDLDALARLLAATDGSPVVLLASGTSARDLAAPAEELPLAPLDRATVITMMRDRGITGPAAPVVGRRLHEEFEGMAGAIHQQLQALFDAGWLVHDGDGLLVRHPLKKVKTDPLPVPAAVRAALSEEAAALGPLERDLVEILALLGRPASRELLERTASELHPSCADEPERTPRALDRLVHRGVLIARRGGELQFARPAATAVLKEDIEPERRRKRHAAIARALGRTRRRDGARQIAEHLMHAGDPAGALPLFVRAARRAARGGAFLEVLEICRLAQGIRAAAERDLSPAEGARHRRWLFLLEGEGQLARGAWEEAIAPLAGAVAAARADADLPFLARSLASLGRAHYRQGRFDLAAPLLEESLRVFDAGAPERASAARALADIRLREGRIEEAIGLWRDALDIAVQIGSRDAEARARRGLAHACALQGRLVEAADLLDAASDLLELGGDDRVRAGVMARAIELDTVSGRYGGALHRARMLVELAHDREMSERLPEAYALLAGVHAAVGDAPAAEQAARDALTYGRALGGGSWDARLRAIRILCDLGLRDEARQAIPAAESLPTSRVDDPSAQVAALRARCAGPVEARDLARWVLVRPVPILGLRAAWIALDASHALAAAGDVEGARTAAKRGLRALEGPGADGLRLELLLALEAASHDDRVVGAARQVALRIADTLPTSLAESFRSRPEIARVLGGG